MIEDDAEAVLSIYGAGIASGDATFESVIPAWTDWEAEHLPRHRFVAERDGAVLGWIAASAVSSRCVYGGVVEVSVYVDPHAQGVGVGSRLLQTFIDSTEQADIWTIQAGLFAENAGSLRVHEKAGFRRIGIQEKLGQMADGTWRDVVLLERRSSHR